MQWSCFVSAITLQPQPHSHRLKIRVDYLHGAPVLSRKTGQHSLTCPAQQEFACMYVWACTWISGPCVFVSSQHSLHVLLLAPLLCVGGLCVAFLFHTDSSIYPSSFCRQCFVLTNRLALMLVTKEPEGRETDWKVIRSAQNDCVCVQGYIQCKQ